MTEWMRNLILTKKKIESVRMGATFSIEDSIFLLILFTLDCFLFLFYFLLHFPLVLLHTHTRAVKFHLHDH